MARPSFKIDWDQFEKLCGIQCTIEEVAAFFRCSPDTIERAVKKHYKERFAVVFKQKRKIGAISLRRTLFQKALEGNTALLIWLSKQHLGMTEKVEQKIDANVSPQKLVIQMDDKD